MRFLPLMLVFMLSACAPSWESSETVQTASSAAKQAALLESSGAATLNGDEVFLIVYREKGFVGSATAWPLQYEGQKVASLKNGSFVAIKTNAGQKTLTPESHLGIYDDGVESLQLNVQAGKTYYLKHQPVSLTNAKVIIREQDPTRAAKEVAAYKLVRVVNDYKAGQQPTVSRFVKSVTGRVNVVRGIKSLPATPGMALQVGDLVEPEAGSKAVLSLDGGIVTTHHPYQVPAPKAAAPAGMFDPVWNKIRQMLNPQPIGISNPTVSSARG